MVPAGVDWQGRLNFICCTIQYEIPMNKVLVPLFLFFSCTQQGVDQSKQAELEIREADIAMSKLAAKAGFFQALLTYAEDSVIFPREGKFPIMSKAEADASWANRPILNGVSWEPVRVVASQSGDMGYSFGFAKFQGDDTTTYTNYCTIWRKQKDGSWKFAYDAGNNTPAPNR